MHWSRENEATVRGDIPEHWPTTGLVIPAQLRSGFSADRRESARKGEHRRSHDAPSSGTVTKITTPGADSAAGKTCSNVTPGRFAARRPAEMIKSRQGRLRQLAIALPAASANTKVALPSVSGVARTCREKRYVGDGVGLASLG
jgi:hypothetical protein